MDCASLSSNKSSPRGESDWQLTASFNSPVNHTLALSRERDSSLQRRALKINAIVRIDIYFFATLLSGNLRVRSLTKSRILSLTSKFNGCLRTRLEWRTSCFFFRLSKSHMCSGRLFSFDHQLNISTIERIILEQCLCQ